MFSIIISSIDGKLIATTSKVASRYLQNISSQFYQKEYSYSIQIPSNCVSDMSKWICKQIYLETITDVEIDIIKNLLQNISAIIIRNPFDRCLSGFIQIFHYQYLMNEKITDKNYPYEDFWVRTVPTDVSFNHELDTTANLDILFNPVPGRDKSLSRLTSDDFNNNEVSLSEWIKEWDVYFNDNIKFGIENNYLKEFLLNEGHCAPFLSIYNDILETYNIDISKIDFVEMLDIDSYLGYKHHMRDSLGIFKKVNQSIFKDYYSTIEEYKKDEELYRIWKKN